MCDSLGISDKKTTYYKFTMLGLSVIYTKEDLIEAVIAEIENLDSEPLEIEISTEEMKESDFENLPEFEGY